MELTKPERLILYMLSQISEKLGIEDGVDPAFLREVIGGGHDWALDWELPGVFPQEIDSPEDVSFVTDVLDMWSFIEWSYDEMDASAKVLVVGTNGEPYAPKFPGFDGNNEPELISIARLFMNHMGRFESFKTHDLNSHHPTRTRYSNMLATFLPLRPSLANGPLSPAQLSSILQAKGF